MRIVGVIPARMASSRFPGKPLALIRGLPMLEHVYRRTRACQLLAEVVIATCDREIAHVAESFGAKTILTSASHDRASDRVAEATARDIAEIVVMVQGDEPLVRPEMIEASVEALLLDATVDCANLATAIRSENELRDRNTIKVVAGLGGHALYFSRQPIPDCGARSLPTHAHLKQVCVIPFRRHALATFASLPRGPLEELESIDMLRFLENGHRVRIVTTDVPTHAVDVPGDVRIVEELMARHPWTILP